MTTFWWNAFAAANDAANGPPCWHLPRAPDGVGVDPGRDCGPPNRTCHAVIKTSVAVGEEGSPHPIVKIKMQKQQQQKCKRKKKNLFFFLIFFFFLCLTSFNWFCNSKLGATGWFRWAELVWLGCSRCCSSAPPPFPFPYHLFLSVLWLRERAPPAHRVLFACQQQTNIGEIKALELIIPQNFRCQKVLIPWAQQKYLKI